MPKMKSRARCRNMPTWIEKVYGNTSHEDRCGHKCDHSYDHEWDDKRDHRCDKCDKVHLSPCDPCARSKEYDSCCKEPAIAPTDSHPFIPNTPRTLKEVLLSLQNEQVQVTTPFGPITGTLIAVKCDYIVMVEATGAQVLVPIDQIELVTEL